MSEYAAKLFPEFLKNSEMWSKGRYGQALEDAFIKFDETLINSDVLDELKRIAGIKKDENNEEDCNNLTKDTVRLICFTYIVRFLSRLSRK